MSHDPETRPSLIARLQSGADDAAWDEFVAIYRPVIVRLAVKRGLQHPDAEDVAQSVLLSVSKRIAQWNIDPQRAKFRTWLRRIARNAAINAITRRPADRAAGGTTAIQLLNATADRAESISAEFDTEWRREAFRWASDEVRNEVHPTTWDAFWLTAVQGVDATQVASQLGKSVGAIYVARCRVMQKIQTRIQELTGGEESPVELPAADRHS
jgi:RNA polymerase sigma-70 factor (ECF subfamily)